MPGLIRLGDGVGLAESNRSVISTSIDLYDMNGNLVGYSTQVNRSDNRTVERVRHLSSDDAGRTVEQAPGPEDVTLDVSGFALYNTPQLDGQFPHFSLAGRLSKGTNLPAIGGEYLFKSINSQKIPFNLKVEEVHPQTKARAITVYFNCMMLTYTKPMNLGAITLAETVRIQVGQVDTPSASNAGGNGIVIGSLQS